MRGLVQLYRKNYSEAVKDFDAFLTVQPKSWAALNDLAVSYLHIGDYEAAEKSARQGLEVELNNPWLQSNLGVALLNQDKLAESQAVLKSALSGFEGMSEDEWARAYPGNAPAVVRDGFAQAKKAIASNIRMSENGGIDEQYSDLGFVSHLDKGIGFSIAACFESVGISVSPTTIQPGGTATLTWNSANVDGITLCR
jgi:tetratricopeptide (TPR) repeat protein